jgi:hypothetical protein
MKNPPLCCLNFGPDIDSKPLEPPGSTLRSGLVPTHCILGRQPVDELVDRLGAVYVARLKTDAAIDASGTPTKPTPALRHNKSP